LGTESGKVEELIKTLRREENRRLTKFATQTVSEGTLRVSIFEGLNLNEYIITKEENCHQNQVCKSGCTEMVLAMCTVLETKVISLPLLWRKSFPAIP